MKKIILFLIMVFSLFASTSCKENMEKPFDPWDELGGGGNANIGENDDLNVETYSPLEIVNVQDSQKEITDENSVTIDLENLVNLPNGVSFENNELTITKKGIYLLKGKFIGSVIIEDCDDEDVRLILDNVEIKTPDDSFNPAILIKKTSGLRVITVKEGTTNILKDSLADTGDEAEEAVISAKKCSLTINGSGTLNLEGVAENSSGIKVKKELTILNTIINITANNNGIKADDLIILENANIKINAQGDGIKTDKEAETIEEANEFASDKGAGYIYIKNTSIDIISGDDGVSANNGLYIDNKEDNLIKIETNNGAPSYITESSSDNADGKALKADGITYVNPDTEEEEDWLACYEENYSLIIIGGTFNINSNDDAITSKGNLIINDGVFTISSGDDAIHAEYVTTIKGGNINIDKCYEGIEGASVEIYSGTINIVSTDDGINAANGDLYNYDYHIYIANGDITVNAQGDGVDSNGWIKMEDGTLTIFGPTSGANGSLDSETGVLILGGTVLAVGPVGMVETPSNNSSQCYININMSTTQNANTKITVYNENEEVIYEVSPTKRYQSVIISLKEFELNKKYIVVVGDQTYETTLEKIGTALGMNQFGGGNQGGRPPMPPRPR